MTNAPADLLELRRVVMTETGLTDPASVGIVGDGAHQRTGGYHEGRDVLSLIGHGPGSANPDYSIRTARDLAGLSNSASAVDIGYRWPRGGNAAWLRFNNLLINQLVAGDSQLSAIRAVNYSPDGVAKRRRDRERGWLVQTSTDTVNVHTHIEFYRDSEGQPSRAATIARLGQIILAAINSTSLEEATMSDQAESILAAIANGLTTFVGSDGRQHDLVPTAEIFRQIEFRKTVLAKLEALAARPAVDPQALAQALSGPLAAALSEAGHLVTQDDIVTALASDAGQAALTQAVRFEESH